MDNACRDFRDAGFPPYFNQPHRASKPYNADADAPFYASHERFLKKIANHEAAIALHYMHYNFARVHKTLRVTTAMEAGISDHVWSLEEIVGLLP